MSGCTFLFATAPQQQHSITSSGGRFILWVEHHFDPIVGDQRHKWATAPRLQPNGDTGGPSGQDVVRTDSKTGVLDFKV